MTNTKFSWSRLLRSALALTLVMAMLLCGCGANPDDTKNPNKNNNNTGSNITLGDGDGKFEAQDVVDGTTTIYGLLLGAIGGGMGNLEMDQGAQMDLAVTLGDDLLSYVSSMLEGYELGSDASWLRQFGISTQMTTNESLMQNKVDVKLGSTTIVSANMIMDMITNASYIGLPGINDTYLGFMTETEEDTSTPAIGSASSVLGSLDAYSDIVNSLPTEQELNTLLSRYLDVVLKALPEATTVTGPLSLGSVTLEATGNSITITNYQVLDIAKAVLTAAKSDADLKKIMDNLSKYSNEKTGETVDLYQEMVDGINEFLEGIDNIRNDFEDGTFMTINTFTYEKQLVGFQLLMETPKLELDYFNLSDGTNTALEVRIADFLQITGTGTVKKNMANGNYDVTVEGTKLMSVEVKDFDMKALEKGNLNGKLRLTLSEAIWENIVENPFVDANTIIEVAMDINDNSSSVAFNLYNGEKLMLGLSILTKMISNSSINVPTQFIDPTKDPEAMEQWLSNADFDQVISNLRKAGVPQALLDMIEQGMEGGFGAEEKVPPVYPEYDEWG